MVDFEALRNAMADLDETKLNALLNEVMANGGKDAQKAVEACQDGMQIVGNRFEAGEYFVGDLIYAGEFLANGIEIIKPALSGDSSKKLGKVLLCTVHDDMHDIGKNIVKAILEATGFEVVDLGIDTPVDLIVNTAKEQNIKIIALSGVLTLALSSMKDTVDGFVSAGIRDKVKIIIGGNPVTEYTFKSVGADEWARSPQKTATVCKGWAVGCLSDNESRA